MLNVGLIGLGHMGRLHMMNCLHVDGVKVVAAADASKRALRKARHIGVKNLYTDYHHLLNDSSDMDAVLISLPNFLHLESVSLALEEGLSVFVEKPLANTVEECRKIVRLADRSGGKFMVGHSMRFLDVTEKMKNILANGRIGDLEVVTVEELLNGPFGHGVVPTPVPEWWFDVKKSGGGVLLDLGYHLIDLFRFFSGGNCSVLFSSLDHKYNLPIEDGAILVLQSSKTSSKGIINVGWFQKSVFPEYNFRVILHGTAGYLSSESIAPRNMYLHALKEGAKNILRKAVGKRIKPLSFTYYYESYYKELRHFFECIENDSDPSVSAIDGLKTIEIIKEAYEANKKHLQRGRDN